MAVPKELPSDCTWTEHQLRNGLRKISYLMIAVIATNVLLFGNQFCGSSSRTIQPPSSHRILTVCQHVRAHAKPVDSYMAYASYLLKAKRPQGPAWSDRQP
jgi:hypothetical protein